MALVKHMRCPGQSWMRLDRASRETCGRSTLPMQMGRGAMKKDQEPLCFNNTAITTSRVVPCSPKFWSRLPQGLNTPARPCPPRFLAMSEAVPGLCLGEQSLSQTEESTSRVDNNLFDHVGEQVVFG